MKVNPSYFLLPFLLILLSINLAACSTVEPAHTPIAVNPETFSVRHDDLIQSQPNIISRQEVHRLSARQEQQFLDFYHAKVRKNIPANQRVADYIEHFVESFT
jgi:hypothetical protein